MSPVDFTMPSLGADMDEGTLLEWLVAPGDPVHKGDVVAVVDTSKSAIEVECFSEGVIERLLVEPGTTVPVGTPLAVIGNGTAVPEERPAAAAERGPVAAPLVQRVAERLGVDLAGVHGTGPHGRVTKEDVEHAAAPPSPAPPPPAQGPPAPLPPAPSPPARARVTPYARRLAVELGVDLAAVSPGGDGAVHAAQVRAAAPRAAPRAAPAEPPAPEPRQARRRGRRSTRSDPRAVTARLMARSKREIPHYYLELTIDLEPALRWMEERNRGLPLERRLVPAALLLKASAVAAARVPELNGFWVDDAFQPASEVNLGVAVSLRGGGLSVPAIRGADALGLEDLMGRLKEQVTRARGGRLRSSEVGIATLTVTNLGDRGVEAVHGVIHPPQVALVGFGAVAPRPWAVDGLLGVRRLTTATLAADHRATDGFTGSRYLTAVDDLLQRPEAL